MKLKYRYEIMEVEGQSFAVPMEDCEGDFGGMVKLSRTAGVIFELLKEDTDEGSIVENMSRKFDAPGDVLEKAVGAPFDPRFYVDYLTRKYDDLIG